METKEISRRYTEKFTYAPEMGYCHATHKGLFRKPLKAEKEQKVASGQHLLWARCAACSISLISTAILLLRYHDCLLFCE